MIEPRKLNLVPVNYSDLNARQKENYNFQKVSAVFAEYGFHTIRLSEDWLGADFIAYHINGEFFRVQLKSRLRLDTKYYGKEIWICFPHKDTWYLYPHDDALLFAIERGLGEVGKKEGWFSEDGQPLAGAAYDWPSPPREWLNWLEQYDLHPQSTKGIPNGYE